MMEGLFHIGRWGDEESYFPVVQRPVVSHAAAGAGVMSRPRKKSIHWGIVVAGVGVVVALVVAGWMMMGMVDDVTFQLPTEQSMLGRFPEVALDEGTFKGIWGEADRGTWIFEYQGVNGEKARPVLVEQMKKAGWVVIEEKGNETRLRRKVAGTFGEHGVVRAKSDRVRMLIMTGDRNAWGTPLDTDLYQDKFYKRNVEERWKE